jgi:hypothetical protein
VTGTRLHVFVRLGRICLATLGGTWLAGCAPQTPYNPDRLPMQQMNRIGEICRDVMGLPAGPFTQYLACEESLSHSLAARHPCVAMAECELSQTALAPGATAPLPAKASESYFSASNDEIHRREQEACGQIGFDPINGGYASAQCVVELQSYMFDADNPRWVP